MGQRLYTDVAKSNGWVYEALGEGVLDGLVDQAANGGLVEAAHQLVALHPKLQHHCR